VSARALVVLLEGAVSLLLEVQVTRAMRHQQVQQLASAWAVECSQLARLQRALSDSRTRRCAQNEKDSYHIAWY
jgi:hypothetical protein